MNLENLYKRFGLKLDKAKAFEIFEKRIFNLLCYTSFKDIFLDLNKNEESKTIFWVICNKLGLEYEPNVLITWNYKHILRYLDCEEYLLRLQVIINTLWERDLKNLANEFAVFISKYFEELPILNHRIIFYKTKAPQIIPTTCKKFETEVNDTLGLLETNKKFHPILSAYENGLKEFFKAKNKEELKDAVEDMYGCCDNLVKVITEDKNRGFKHISDKDVAKTLCLNGHQKELYKNLRTWMDNIKHGSLSDFDKNDVEMIISMVSSLIRYVILKHEAKNN
jgi:hypothetical protein